jgi:hypothetical protein
MATDAGEDLAGANEAAMDEFDTGDVGAVQECPRSRGRAMLDKVKSTLRGYKAAVQEKLRNLFTDDERAALQSMRDNVGVFPIFNAHGFALDAIFHRVDKEFGWDRKEEGADADAGR